MPLVGPPVANRSQVRDPKKHNPKEPLWWEENVCRQSLHSSCSWEKMQRELSYATTPAKRMIIIKGFGFVCLFFLASPPFFLLIHTHHPFISQWQMVFSSLLKSCLLLHLTCIQSSRSQMLIIGMTDIAAYRRWFKSEILRSHPPSLYQKQFSPHRHLDGFLFFFLFFFKFGHFI